MPPATASARIVLTTVASVDDGHRLARLLVERRLAACVNLIPNLTSIYRWEGAVAEGAEVLMLIKTTAEMLPALEDTVRDRHSYEVPEFLTLAVESGSQLYLDWILDSVGE
jgi:periplasmic divalent cation tolerance protein